VQPPRPVAVVEGSTRRDDDEGGFLPDPLVFQRALEQMGFSRTKFCASATATWTTARAKAAGLRVVWVNRDGRSSRNF
jgi:FMN phosphatase YigB (HAD superfamily)